MTPSHSADLALIERSTSAAVDLPGMIHRHQWEERMAIPLALWRGCSGHPRDWRYDAAQHR
jgi:hypothetical protein